MRLRTLTIRQLMILVAFAGVWAWCVGALLRIIPMRLGWRIFATIAVLPLPASSMALALMLLLFDRNTADRDALVVELFGLTHMCAVSFLMILLIVHLTSFETWETTAHSLFVVAVGAYCIRWSYAHSRKRTDEETEK